MRRFWTGFYWFNWLLIIAFWLAGSEGIWQLGTAGILIAFGRLSGLAGAYQVLLQFFLMGRNPWLERVYGLDTLSRMHARSGRRLIIYLLAHPIFLILGYAILSENSWLNQTLLFVTEYPYVLWSLIGLGLFVLVVITSLAIIRLKLRYETWYFAHLLVYLAVFLSFWHQIENGTTLLHNQLFYWYWVILYILVFISLLVFRFIRPVWKYRQHQFYIEQIKRESPSTVSVYISGRHLERFKIKPGQFMIVRFLTKKLWWQAHPFSLSMLPDGKTLRITIKELGDFTREIKNLQPGTKIMIDGPYGIFTDFLGLSSKVLLIAGGIGITPIRSLMEDLLAKGHNIVLLYANKAKTDIVFEHELETLRQKYPARIIHVLSNETAHEGENGFIDEEKIKRLVPDYLEREVYLCGPLPMMAALVETLTKLGKQLSQIHYEKFSFA